MTAALQTPPIDATAADLLLAEFRRAATQVPAYRVLLDEHGVRAADVRDVRDVLGASARCSPRPTRSTAFPLSQLSVGGRLQDVGEVLTSSGHGGRFSFGVISRAEAASSAAFVDAALDAAFAVKSKTTLAINCLPMGVVVSSRCMTVATTSVREDMAVALVKTFGDGYDQIVLIGDPLFMKRLTDHAIEQGLDWRRYRMNAVIGEETFGEHFRHFIESCLGLEPNRPGGGHIMSSFGVGELGLHLCFETAGDGRAGACHPGESGAGARSAGRGRSGAAGRGSRWCSRSTPSEPSSRSSTQTTTGYGTMAISMLDPTPPGADAPLPDRRRGAPARS